MQHNERVVQRVGSSMQHLPLFVDVVQNTFTVNAAAKLNLSSHGAVYSTVYV